MSWPRADQLISNELLHGLDPFLDGLLHDCTCTHEQRELIGNFGSN